jgi:parvulin-like peptidyl-prolyl isomerase
LTKRAQSCFIRGMSVSFTSLLLSVVVASSYAFTVDRVLATVDKEAVTLSDYFLFAKTLGVQSEKDSVDEKTLRKLIEEKVILQEAKRRGIEASDSETERMIEELRKESGLSREDFEKELIKEGTNIQRYRGLMKEKVTAMKLIDAEVDSKVAVTEGEIEAFYHTEWRDFLVSPARVDLKAIFLRLSEDAAATEITDLKRKALHITARLKQGDSFEAMVNRYSDEPLKGKGGNLGEFGRGTLLPQLDERAFSMNVGETSDPIWVREGVYILRLEGKVDDIFRPLSDVRQEIQRRLSSQRREQILNEWVRILWEKASVTIN